MSIFQHLIGGILHGGLSWLSRRRQPQVKGTLILPDLEAPLEILRDRWGVPHIYAETLHDLFFAQGFVHAQERLFQMEVNRRTAQGRLSEVFGEIALDTDRTARTFGFNRLGRKDWEAASDFMRQAIQAYSQGVNAWLMSPAFKPPIEFTLLGIQPQTWKPQDTTAFSRVMIWQLSHAWDSEIIRAQIIEKVGAERAAELEIHYPPENPLTLPQGIEFNLLGEEGKLIKGGGPFIQRGMGSNAWVVSGERTQSGSPYLCNDMHLALGTPSLWYEAHLVAGGYNVSGVTLPGVPGVMVGHNQRIAWGMTLAFTDCEDLFIEQFDPEEEARYRFGDAWRDAQVVEETILVKGRLEPHIERVLITHHGPIISDVIGVKRERLAVNSMALQPGRIMEGWMQLNQAQNWDEFVAAMRLIEAPQLNVAYADVEGNIGYWVTGRVPVRAKGDGSLPAPGWTGEYEWIGEVPFEEMPYALNPNNGYLVTCNHKIVAENYPHFLGNMWMNGYRARRIESVLESKPQLDTVDFQRLHVDFTCLPGLELAARLKDFTPQDVKAQRLLERLKQWDGVLDHESVGGCIYEVLRYRLVDNLVTPALGETLSLRWRGQGFHPVLNASNEFYGHDTLTLLRLLDNPDSWWLRQAGGREALIERSLRETYDWLKEKLGADMDSWQWGRLHHAIFPHPLSLQKPLDLVFNPPPMPIGGDTDTPCQTAFHASDPYDNNAWAPSYRQIIDLGDLSRSLAIHPPGQSGILGNRHYDDLAKLWIRGEYHPMLWEREQVEAELESRLVLQPTEE